MESASRDTAKKLGRTAHWQGDLQGQGLLVWEAGKLGDQRVSKPKMGISGAFTATRRLQGISWEAVPPSRLELLASAHVRRQC